MDYSEEDHLEQHQQAETFLAKALYDNLAESADEIAFKRGDVLTVIEQDTGGLMGWWLCTFRGKQGIAPGNRLKILTGMIENGKDFPVYGSPSPSPSSPTTSWQRRSWDVTPNKVVIPRKVGEVFSQQPNRTNEDYDVPPSRFFSNENLISSDHPDFQGNYDTPPKSKIVITDTDSRHLLYDTPPSGRTGEQSSRSASLTPLDAYDVPPSNRSSMLSCVSNDSTMTLSSSASNLSLLRSSNPPSICDSARSSLDASASDLYDVPPDPRAVKQLSTDSGLDLYDTPPKPKPTSSLVSTEDYDVPRSMLGDYDNPASDQSYDVPSLLCEHALDDIYDTPKNNAPCADVSNLSSNASFSKSTAHSSGVYDIPPQVTRDSVLSFKSDSSDGDGQRLSSCSTDSRNSDIPIYSELPLTLDAAMDLLIKQQQNVQKATTRLSSFVSSTWRRKENLEPKLYEIKVACVEVKSCLEEFVMFAQGTLGNSVRTADRKVIGKLHKQLTPLQNSLQQVKKCLKSLDEIKWQISCLVSSDLHKDDDLGQIANLSKDLSSDVRKLASFIQGNSVLLFKTGSDQSSSKVETVITSKFAPPLPTKVGSETGLKILPDSKYGSVQKRPLPPTPLQKNRPLPPTPQANQSLMKSQDEHYLSPKGLPIKRKLEGLEQENDNDFVDSQEYDYVQLETRDLQSEQKNNNSRVVAMKETEKEINLENSIGAQLTEMSLSEDLDIEKLAENMRTPVNKDAENFMVPQINKVFNQTCLDPNDRQVLSFYSEQINTHFTLLNNSVEAFFGCIENSEPPKVFISHSKFVVLTAHKLVYIGDTLHRNLMNADFRDKIIHCANQLCDNLKSTVTSTKTAALQYPSVQAVQDMVDRVMSVSHAAHELKIVIAQASLL